MMNIYNHEQGHILKYILDEYMPWKHQWAQYLISCYRNYGQRVNSPVEAAHRQLKSFLMTGTGHLYHLHQALIQMIEHKKRVYAQERARQEVKQLLIYRDVSWLGDLHHKVSHLAMKLIWQQGIRARATDPTHNNPQLLSDCSHRFEHQYGLPCSHTILNIIINKGTIQKEEIHPRWWLQKPISYDDEISRIRDPAIVENLRGRPRLANNNKVAVPSSLMPPSSTASTSAAPPSTRRTQSSQQGRRRLPASITRHQTQAEAEEASFEASQRPTKRPRSTRASRGRAQGCRARTTSQAPSSTLGSISEGGIIEGDCIEVIPATQPDLP